MRMLRSSCNSFRSERNENVTRSIYKIAAIASFSHFNIKTTSPLPHGGDFNIEDDQVFSPHRG